MKNIAKLTSLISAFLLAPALYSQDSRSALEERLTARYTLTHPSGDERDILSAGVVLTLKKDRLMMVPISNPNLFPNQYKDGKISQSILTHTPGVPKRMFMTTEKVWVTQIQVKDDCVLFNLLSDPIDDVRYKGVLRFPFAKGTVPMYDEMAASIGQVFSDEAWPAQAGNPPNPPGNRAQFPPPNQQGMKPDPQAPKEISLGQSPEQVVAILGQPQKILKSATSQTYIYPDIRVIFTDNKVTDFK